VDFKLVAKTEVQKVVREGTYDEDLMNTVKEIWTVAQEHGQTHNIYLPSFGSGEEGATAARKWMVKAQNYGKTIGVFVHQVRNVAPEEENGLVVNAESLQEREDRIAARKQREEENQAIKEAGGTVKRGGPRKGAGRKKSEPVAA